MKSEMANKNTNVNKTKLLKSWDEIKIGEGVMICLFVYNVFNYFRRLSKKDFKFHGKQQNIKVPFLFLVNFTGYCIQKGCRNSKPYIKIQTCYGKEKICFLFFMSALNFVFLKRLVKK
jgi:hypothetical protein